MARNKVRLEIDYDNRVGGGSSTRLKIRFWPKTLSDRAVKFFWGQTGFAKGGTHCFDEDANSISEREYNDA